MTPETTQRINGILEYLEQAIRTTGEFAVEQTPMVVEELLRWKFVESLLVWISCLGFVISYGVLARKVALKTKEDPELWEEPKPSTVLTIVLVIPLTVAAAKLFMSVDWLQIWLAPRVYLLEYASTLLK